MNRSVLGAIALLGLAACDHPVRPSDPVRTTTPPAVSVAAEAELTARNLGTLGGDFSAGWNINERTKVVGDATLPSGQLRAFLWSPGRGMRTLGSFSGDFNEFGEIAGDVATTRGIRAVLWRPRGLGPLAASPAGAAGEYEVAAAEGERTSVPSYLCAVERRFKRWFRSRILALRACGAR